MLRRIKEVAHLVNRAEWHNQTEVQTIEALFMEYTFLSNVLSQFNYHQKKKAFHKIKILHFTKGQHVFKIDDKDPVAFFILAGKIELYKEEPVDGQRALELAKDEEVIKIDTEKIKLKQRFSKLSMRIDATKKELAQTFETKD